MEIKIYRLNYEDGEYTVGTEAEVVNRHNLWVESSGRFEEEEIADAKAKTIKDESLNEHWTVELIYTVVLKVEEEL